MNQLSSACLTDFTLIKGSRKAFKSIFCRALWLYTVVEKYECRARKWQHGFVEIDRRRYSVGSPFTISGDTRSLGW